MASFEVGEAYVSLLPTARGFSKEAKKALAATDDLNKDVELDVKADKLQAAIKQVKGELAQLEREKTNPSIELDTAVAEARLTELRDKLKELQKGKVDPKVEVDLVRAQAEVDKFSAKIDALGKKKATPKVTADIAAAQVQLDQANAKLDALNQKKANPKIDAVGIAEAQRDIAKVEAQLAALNARKASVNVDAEIAEGMAQLAAFEAKLAEIERAKAEPKVTADTSSAMARLAELDGRLRDLSSRRAMPEVELQVAQAQQQALRIRAELDRLGSERVTPQVTADIALASAQLARINQQLSAIDGKRVNANVSASGNATLILSGIVAALGAVAAAAPAAIAALAAVGGAAGALGQGAAAGIIGFSGIGDALKALESDEKSAATSSASSSNKRATGAKQVASAQSALGQAQTQADRAAITGAQQVAAAQQSLGQARTQQARTAVQGAQQVQDAERALGQAVQQAARARITADQQVASARRAVSDAIQAANQRVASAERSLESAQRGRQAAQESLTRAVEDATRANRDLQLSVSGAALSEERATLSLAQARDRLAKSTSTDPLERADLSLAVREAEQNLKEVQTRYGDLRQEQGQWAATGVMGSRQVVDATRAVGDAQRSVEDAQRGLSEAQVSGARQVSDAQMSLAQAQQSAAWSVADAQQGVVEAQRSVQRATVSAAQANADAADQVSQAQLGVSQAVQQAGWAQQDAARQVADAQRALAEAYTAGGESAAGAANTAAYALSKLTPAGRSMVNFLKNEFQPAWKRVTDSVAGEMLPKVETALRNALKLEPTITKGLTDAGQALGDLALRGSALATSPAFQASFAGIMASNNRQLRDYGSAGINLFGAFTDLYSIAGPVAERFSRLADYSANAFESWVLGAQQSGALERGLQSAADTLQYLGGWFLDVGGDVVSFTMSFAPLGVALLEGVRYATDFISTIASWSPTLTSIVGGLGLAAVAMSKLGTATAALSVAGAAGGIGGLASSVKTLLTPSLLAATGPMTALAGAGANLGGKMGEVTGKITGSTTAIANGAAAGSKFTGMLATGASYAPLLAAAVAGVALAYDAFVTSASEASNAVITGKQTFAQMNDSLYAQNALVEGARVAFGDWYSDLVGQVIPGSKQAVASFGEQFRAMSQLDAMQTLASISQKAYEDALIRFGATSPQAVAAQTTLQNSTRNVEIAQIAVREKTDAATAAILYQSQQIMGTLNADLAKQQSLLSIERAQKTYNDAVAANGPKSLEARTAYVQYEQSLLAGIASVQQAAQKQYELEGRTDAAAQAQRDADAAALNMANTIRGNIPDALGKYIGSMDAGRLSAIGARVKTDEFGNAVVMLPNGKAVPISAPGAVQARDEVNSLRDSLRRLQDMGMVTVPMQVAGGTFQPAPAPAPGAPPIFRPYAAGGVVQGFPSGGSVSGPGSGTSDSIPARLSNGEYVINASAVQRIGVKALDALNGKGYALGGLVGYATGGAVKPAAPAAAAASPGAVPVPVGDPGATAAAASSTSALASSMATATGQAQTLNPVLTALAATQATLLAPATAAVTAGQQAMVAAGIVPLASSILSTLSPAFGVYEQQVGVAAPLANTALQTAQLGTQLSTNATAVNTALNSAAMNAAVTGMSLTGQVQHAALRGSQMMTQASNRLTADSTALNSQNMAISTTNMSLIGQQQHGNLRISQGLTQAQTTATALNTAANNANMIATTGNMSATNQGHLAFLRGGLDTTKMSAQGTADWWQQQMGRMIPDSANPIRWILNFPMRSIVDAWNNLDGQFALGKHVNPVLPGFATGGHITGPGSGTSDSIMARLSDGEFVVRESVASRVPHFLNALNSGQPEAIQAAGGRAANPYPGYAAGGMIAAQQFAKSQNGKPYQWGGTGNPSWDCSGFMSGITKALRGQNPFSGLLGTTSTMPWGGFVPGLRGAFTIGNTKSRGHMAGTLAGVNVESGGSHGVHYGPPAIGADNGLFNEKYTLPEVGGVFASGGAGGGGGFDPTPMVDAAFAKAYREIGDIAKNFGNSPQVGRDAGVAKAGADGVKAKAMAKLQEMFAGSGLFGPVGDGAAFVVKQISDAARIYNKGVDGATIGVATGLVESNLRNLPGGDRDSVGVFQQRPSQGWGSIQECMNVLHAAGEFFKRFPGNWRSMVPGDVAQSVQRSAFPAKYQQRMGQARGLVAQYGGAFDNGGLLSPGVTLAQNATGAPERILNNVETRNYDTLTRLMGRGGVKVDSSVTDTGKQQIVVNVHPRELQSEEKIAAAVTRELTWQGRL